MDIPSRALARKIASTIVKREIKDGVSYKPSTSFDLLQTKYQYVESPEDEKYLARLVEAEILAERVARERNVSISKQAMAHHVWDEITNNLPIDEPEGEPQPE